MSPSPTLHQRLHARLREVFGEPDPLLTREDHWTLKPGPYKSAITLLVDGTGTTPAIWLFDPHMHNDGVLRRAIRSEQEVEIVIEQIEARVRRAAALSARSGRGTP